MAPRRLSLRAYLVATALALVAALGAAALAARGEDGSAAGSGRTEGYELAEAPPEAAVPDSTAAVRLGALDGGADRTLGELMGKPMVLNFFGSWCAPCVLEMPAIERVHRSLGDQVTFVGMASRDRPEDALATVASTGITYAAFTDPDDAVTWFGGLIMPTTVFLDASGKVLDVHSGPLTEDELRTAIGDRFGVAA
ncbi:MAG TPA: TlpA disulfide reductase family protein [Acidimicrobiales bacterium]|nr:TlpA disulfide reductase family protein [Acidimicrobiales bacterium]